MTGTELPVPSAGPADVPVAIASGGAPWELHLIPAIERHRSGLHLVRRCVDIADLLAVSRAGMVAVAVVDAALPRLDRDEVARLRSDGVAVLLVEDASTLGTSLSLGAADCVGAGEDVERVVSRIRALSSQPPASVPVEEPARQTEPAPTGRLVAVWGPNGAPGRTTLAVNLAAESALSGESALLVDADTAGGAVSTVLGLLDEAPGLAAACRAAARGRLDPAVLAAHALQVEPNLRVLTGATRPDRWRELRPAALEAVWESARHLADLVVVDLAAGLDGDDGHPYDTALVRPGGVSSAVLGVADLVVVVGSADPLGMLRLVHALDQLTESASHLPRLVVVNRVRESVVGRHPARQVRLALDRFAAVAAVHVLPFDADAADLAIRRAQPLARVAPSSPLRTGVVEVLRAARPSTADATGPMTGRRGRRRRSVASRG